MGDYARRKGHVSPTSKKVKTRKMDSPKGTTPDVKGMCFFPISKKSKPAKKDSPEGAYTRHEGRAVSTKR